MAKLFANSGDPDQTPWASDLGLHCLPITLLWVSRLHWFNSDQCLFFSAVDFQNQPIISMTTHIRSFLLMKALVRLYRCLCLHVHLTLVLLNPDIHLYPVFANSVDPDQLASKTGLCHLIYEFMSTIWIKLPDWLKIRSGRGILIYSAWHFFLGLISPFSLILSQIYLYKQIYTVIPCFVFLSVYHGVLL